MFLTSLIALIALTASAAENQIQHDTSYVRQGNIVLKKVISKKEKVISEFKFRRVDSNIFTDREIKEMEKGKVIEKTFYEKKLIPDKIFPVVEMTSFKTTSFYKIENRTVKEIKKEGFLKGTDFSKENKAISILWLYLPFFLIFLISLKMKYKKGWREDFFIFSVLTTGAITVSICVGWFIGLLFGTIAGTSAGVAAGWFIGGIAGMYGGMFLGTATGIITGVFSGVFAGRIGGSFLETSFFDNVLWSYVGFYTVICFLIFLLKEIMYLFQKRKLKTVLNG